MTEKKMYNIINRVIEKYQDVPCSVAGKLIMNDLSSVIRGLYEREDFLRGITIKNKIIICHNKECWDFISFLPYLDKSVLDDELYNVYLEVAQNIVSTVGLVRFIDTNKIESDCIGYDLEFHKVQNVFLYYHGGIETL